MDDVGTFDRFARAYDLLMPGAKRSTLRTGLAHADRPVEVVLDLAGGTGRALRSLSSVDGVVVDAAAGMAQVARDSGLATIVGDAGQLPLGQETVDAVLVVDALHHTPSPRQTLTEAAGVLRPGGVLVVADFDPRSMRGRALATGEHLLGFDSTFLSASAIADAIARNGLEPVVIDEGFSYAVAGVREREE